MIIVEDDGFFDGFMIVVDGSVWVVLWGGSVVCGYDVFG